MKTEFFRNISYPGPPTHGFFDVGQVAFDSNGVAWMALTAGGAADTATFISSEDSGSSVISPEGTNTATNGAHVLTPTFSSGTAAQLSDLTRDYMLYVDITTSGTATTFAIGPTSTPANTLVASSAQTAGSLLTIRLPAGWYFKWSGTTTAISTTAISC